MNPRAADIRVRRSLEDACDPRHLALLVYDMQVGVVGQIADARRVTERVTSVLAAARAAGVRTLFTRHVSLPMELTGAAGLRTAMDWQHTDDVDKLISAFPPNAAGTQLLPELDPRPSEAVFDKLAMSAFVGTPLDFVLRDAGIEAFAIVGVALEVGIEPTVRHALDLGYLPVVVTDACGAGDREAARRSLDQLAWFGGSIQTDAATLTAQLGGSR
ncbi:cysteine hydrolase family protein [Pseudonocardia acaciae]|uniref:cysteine hydrolase family protein n=1 Tax=Pseudonocardia acaciae TaxID=551276 RepID=UPI00048BAA73|nr:cysteine hydrolase [Pseudonocardia acaciae]